MEDAGASEGNILIFYLSLDISRCQICKLLGSFSWDKVLHCYLCHGGHNTVGSVGAHICVYGKCSKIGFIESKGGRLHS